MLHNTVLNILIILIGKIVSFISRFLKKGDGSTWPGHIALSINNNFILEQLSLNLKLKVILIVGTNGKTTTSKIIATILEKSGKRVFQNNSGANLLNGVASALILNSNIYGKLNYDYAIFEIDENILPLILKRITPFAIVILNLFRDQLDRYGELNAIANKWKNAFLNLSKNSTLILNADDPLISFLGDSLMVKTVYFGLEEKEFKHNKLQHASDSIYCPKCYEKLIFKNISYSHLGIWECNNCGLKRPNPSVKNISSSILSGTYNTYNLLAAKAVALETGSNEEQIEKAIRQVEPVFGRQEKIKINGKYIQIFLSKNPASFNQSLETIIGIGLRAKSIGQRKPISRQRGITVLFILNDRIPDGMDVSWIWDIDFEQYIESFKPIFISGDRLYDMALRIEYTYNTAKGEELRAKSKEHQPTEGDREIVIKEDLKEAIETALQSIKTGETLYILPTYSAMLEVRKILTGKKIL